jgi:hypothetical protein
MGLSVISVSAPPGPHQLRLEYLLDLDRRIGLERRHSRSDVLCNYRLVRINGDVLDDDLLLPSASMMVEPFGQQHHSPGCPVPTSRVADGSRPTDWNSEKLETQYRLTSAGWSVILRSNTIAKAALAISVLSFAVVIIRAAYGT